MYQTEVFYTEQISGREILDKKVFQDVWMLLSDGKFQSSSEKKAEIMKIIINDLYEDEVQKSKSPQTTNPKEVLPLTSKYKICKIPKSSYG